MNTRTCPTCEAKWINDQHFWSTGKLGNELDLAGLCCNKLSKGRTCINPLKGQEGGQTWEERNNNLTAALAEHNLVHNFDAVKS